jgi:hypothetical protein
MPKVKTEIYYSPSDIADQGLFPWTKRRKTVIAWINKMIEHGKAKKYGLRVLPALSSEEKSKHGQRYLVSRTGLIKIIAAYEDGTLLEGK